MPSKPNGTPDNTPDDQILIFSTYQDVSGMKFEYAIGRKGITTIGGMMEVRSLRIPKELLTPEEKRFLDQVHVQILKRASAQISHPNIITLSKEIVV